MYLLRGNTLRNNSIANANAAQLHWLKSKYGDNWQKGAEKDPTVSLDPDYAKKKRAEVEQQKKQSLNKSISDSVVELAKKGSISSSQANKLLNIANSK